MSTYISSFTKIMKTNLFPRREAALINFMNIFQPEKYETDFFIHEIRDIDSILSFFKTCVLGIEMYNQIFVVCLMVNNNYPNRY